MATQHEHTWSNILEVFFQLFLFFLPPVELQLQDDSDTEKYTEKGKKNNFRSHKQHALVVSCFFFCKF